MENADIFECVVETQNDGLTNSKCHVDLAK